MLKDGERAVESDDQPSFSKIVVCPSLAPNLPLPYANIELVIQGGKMCDYQVQGPQLDGLPTPQWPQRDFGRQDGSRQQLVVPGAHFTLPPGPAAKLLTYCQRVRTSQPTFRVLVSRKSTPPLSSPPSSPWTRSSEMARWRMKRCVLLSLCAVFTHHCLGG